MYLSSTHLILGFILGKFSNSLVWWFFDIFQHFCISDKYKTCTMAVSPPYFCRLGAAWSLGYQRIRWYYPRTILSPPCTLSQMFVLDWLWQDFVAPGFRFSKSISSLKQGLAWKGFATNLYFLVFWKSLEKIWIRDLQVHQEVAAWTVDMATVTLEHKNCS